MAVIHVTFIIFNKNSYELELIYDFRSSLPHLWGAYRLDFNGPSVNVIHPGLGAPLAIAVMEEMIALGCRKFVACGVAGVIDDILDRGSVIIPSAALRDKDTSSSLNRHNSFHLQV